jgi:hypothetical protein
MTEGFKSQNLAVLRRTFAAYRITRNYMTAASVMFDLKTSVAPFVGFLRLTRQDSALMICLVMDNHGMQNTPILFRR